MALYWVDAAISAVIGLSVFTGMFRGFVKELISLGVWVLAFWCAITYSHIAAAWFQPYVADKTACTAIGFVIILVLTLILGAVVNGIVSHVLHRSGLSGIDRMLGMGFGFVRGVFIVALIMMVFKMTSLPVEEYRSHSVLYAKFDPLVDRLYTYTPDVIKKMAKFDNSSKESAFQAIMPEDSSNTEE